MNDLAGQADPVREGMAKFKKLNLPANMQTSFDDVAKPKMDAHLAEAKAKAKAKMTQAEAKRRPSAG